MCQAQERPQRRHRPMYVAPSAGQWHLPPPPPPPPPRSPQQQQQRQQQQQQQQHTVPEPTSFYEPSHQPQHRQRRQTRWNHDEHPSRNHHTPQRPRRSLPEPPQHQEYFPNLSRTQPQHFFVPGTPPESLSDLGIPLLLEVPATGHPVVSPPSSGEVSSIEMEAHDSPQQQQQQQQQRHYSHSRWSTTATTSRQNNFLGRCKHAISSCYHGFVDFVLLVAVCLMGCFFYDVEVKVVQSDRRRRRGGRSGGRVVIQTERKRNQRHRGEYRGVATSLLRTPPISGASISLQEEVRTLVQNDSNNMWEHIV